MSFRYHAHTVIGVMMAREKLYEGKKIRGCKHPERDSSFCPVCGRPMWKTIQSAIPGYDGDSRLNGLDVVDDIAREIVVIGLASPETSDRQTATRMPKFQWDKAQQRIKEILEPLGLWREDSFGIWTVLCGG